MPGLLSNSAQASRDPHGSHVSAESDLFIHVDHVIEIFICRWTFKNTFTVLYMKVGVFIAYTLKSAYVTFMALTLEMPGWNVLHKYGKFNLTCPLKQPDCLQPALTAHTV